jgi:N-dimethylarginine dimethylaminohydrolase
MLSSAMVSVPRMGLGVTLVDGLCVQSEWDRLAVVGVVRPAFFALTEPINHTQQRFYGTVEHPSTTTLLLQHDRILRLFAAQGIRVVEIPPASDLPFQFNVRDAAVVIGSRLILSRMAREVRSREPDFLAASLGLQPALAIPAGRLEGGDVMVTPSEVFVGLSERTDELGYTSLRGLLAGNRVTPIRLTGRALHLDVALNLLGVRLGVIHRPSIFGDLPPSLGAVEWIEVTDEEFAEQAVNVMVLDPGTVMLDARHERLQAALKAKGLRCFPVELDEITKVGGGVRCMTLPLARIHVRDSCVTDMEVRN